MGESEEGAASEEAVEAPGAFNRKSLIGRIKYVSGVRRGNTMKLPDCSTCHYSFQWKELLFIMGVKRCPKCGVHQYITAQRKRQGLWFGPVAGIITAVIVQTAPLPFSFIWAVAGVLITAAILINPFWLEFTEKDEPLF